MYGSAVGNDYSGNVARAFGNFDTDPQPPEPWTGIRDAFTEGAKSPQLNIFTKEMIGDDDCLYLNVATTSLTGSRPVMVWIHGGSFVGGDGGSDKHGPDYLMESEIVHVGFKYRVGVLGFLQLDHEVASGNMGLKDQIAALKWVQENISQFGGDPNNVTIFGVSAGSMSIHYLLLSPLARGLFHKAIMQSGVSIDIGARVPNPIETAHRFVAKLGKDITDPVEIVEYLRTVPVQKLIETQINMITPEERFRKILPFAPTVDLESVKSLFPGPFEELVRKGFDIPVMIGYNTHEGAMFLMGLQDEEWTKLDENFEMTVPQHLVIKAPEKLPVIAKEIRKFYFGDDSITKDSVDEYIQYFGDQVFVMGIHKVVNIQIAKKSPTYLYRFSYGNPESIARMLFPVQGKGAIHTEEVEYLFFPTLFREHIKMEPGSTEDTLRRRFVRMWTDFAKTGNPTPGIDDLITVKWEPVTRTAKNYLEIGADLSAGVNPDEDKWQMWERIETMANER